MRVCAFATWPGQIPAGATIDEPMHGVDWYPTLLKLAGASIEQPLASDGRDIFPVLTEGAKSPHDAILLMGTQPGKAAIRMVAWKLVLNGSQQDAEESPADATRTAEKVELYNIANDIGEAKNLAETEPEKVQELRARLNVFLQDAVKPGNPAPVNSANSQKCKNRNKKKAAK